MKLTDQTPRPELSFDGAGINGPDEYRTRIATFSNGADKYGPLFAAAPELLEALRTMVEQAGCYMDDGEATQEEMSAMDAARAAIAKAGGGAQ